MLHATLCSSVFALGEPHRQASHPDYVPSVFPAVYKQAKRRDQRGPRYRRLEQRRVTSGNSFPQPKVKILLQVSQ